MNSILFHSDNSFRFLKRLMPLLFAFLILLPLSAATVNLAPDVTPDMLNANYWIAKATNPFDVIMTPEDIVLFNKEITHCWSDGKTPYKIFYDLRTFGDKADGRFISDAITDLFPDYDCYQKADDGTISTISKATWQSWYDATRYVEINDTSYPVRKALCIKHCVVQAFPVEEFFSSDSGYWLDDEMALTSLFMNMPLIVLWESADGEWYFIQSEYYKGWVRKACVVFVDDAEFERYFGYDERDDADFVVITENRFTIEKQYYIPSECEEPIQDLFMGTILNIVDWESNPLFLETFGQREPHASYLVEIPYKKADETLGYRYAELSAGACSKGFLPFTQANVLTLAFKPLGDRYGWGGSIECEDCSGLVLEAYRCFGFQLARDSSGQCCMPGKILFVDEAPVEEKKLICRMIPAGAIMYFKGHMFLFIGCENGKEYVLSSMGGYYTERGNSDSHHEAASVNINTLDVIRSTGSSWGEMLARIILLTNPGKYPGVNVRD